MNKDSEQRMNLVRFRKNLKRKSKKAKLLQSEINNRIYIQSKIIERKNRNIRKNYVPPLFNYLKNILFNSESVNSNLSTPNIFCLDEANIESMNYIESVFSTLYEGIIEGKGDFIISFKECTKLNLGSLMVINVLTRDFLMWRRKMKNIGISNSYLPSLTLDDEMSVDVNNLLATMHFPVLPKLDRKIAIPGFRLIEGRANRKSYVDTSKGKVAKKIRKYVDNCIKLFEVELSDEGIGLFDNMIGEILANADDHSGIDRWYVYGSFILHSEEDKDSVGELNLIFLNFGPTFYEGILSSKDENEEVYSRMKQLYDYSITRNNLTSELPMESMVMLYTLQEGASRLLHKDISRGTGTMTFIRAFLDLGVSSEKYESKLYLLSGKTVIKCDYSHAPFMKENRYYLSLNNEQSLKVPPSRDHISTKNKKFPGTILLAKAFLDKVHLKNKV